MYTVFTLIIIIYDRTCVHCHEYYCNGILISAHVHIHACMHDHLTNLSFALVDGEAAAAVGGFS